MTEIKGLFCPRYHVYVIEFQKWGLPHIMLKVCECLAPTTSQLGKDIDLNDIDDIISVQVPDSPGHLHDLVLTHMVHGEDHLTCPYSRCNGQCMYNFPLPPNPYTHINQLQQIEYR
jgi:hypothetical protein